MTEKYKLTYSKDILQCFFSIQILIAGGQNLGFSSPVSHLTNTSAVTYAVEFSCPCFHSQCGHTKAKAPSENNFTKQNCKKKC